MKEQAAGDEEAVTQKEASGSADTTSFLPTKLSVCQSQDGEEEKNHVVPSDSKSWESMRDDCCNVSCTSFRLLLKQLEERQQKRKKETGQYFCQTSGQSIT